MQNKIPIRENAGISQALGVLGWKHLDPILLAALATKSPLLLIGPHGTAKSFLVERIAKALQKPMRHYNAALLNYDDMVGIPMPDASGTRMNFITTPGTIWDAGFVFFDEISRCRADLQNKLFPIIHERRVIGMDLEKLEHRWAAMNPPAPEDPNTQNIQASYYLGSEPLDPALIDRFPYIVPVPNWADLGKEEQQALVSWKAGSLDNIEELDITWMVDECARLIPELEAQFSEWIGDYVVCLMDQLEQAQLPQSPRRAAMLARSVVAVHAARMVLEGDDADPEESAQIAIMYSIPHNATEVPPAPIKLIALHKQAWEMAEFLEDDQWRRVLEESSYARRVALADQLDFSDEDISRLVTQALGNEESDARQMGLATAMFLAFNTRRNLEPSAFEPLAQLAYHVLEPRATSIGVEKDGDQAKAWEAIKQWVDNQTGRDNSFLFRLERNFLLNGITNFWQKQNWQDALTQFKEDLILFGIREAE